MADPIAKITKRTRTHDGRGGVALIVEYEVETTAGLKYIEQLVAMRAEMQTNIFGPFTADDLTRWLTAHAYRLEELAAAEAEIDRLVGLDLVAAAKEPK